MQEFCVKILFAGNISLRSSHLWKREGSGSVYLTNVSGSGSPTLLYRYVGYVPERSSHGPCLYRWCSEPDLRQQYCSPWIQKSKVKQSDRVKTRVEGRVISKNYRDPLFKERKKDRNWVWHFRTAETWILVRLKIIFLPINCLFYPQKSLILTFCKNGLFFAIWQEYALKVFFFSLGNIGYHSE
jgi:hypothetical protein